MKSGLWGSFFRGWGIGLKNPSLVFLKWFFNLLAALLIIGPIFDLLSGQLDHGEMAGKLSPRVDGLVLEEFLLANREALGAFAAYWLPIVIIFLLFNLYLNGGILDAVQRERRPSWPHFFDACAHHFASLLMIALLSVILCGLVSVPLYWGASSSFQYLEALFPRERITMPLRWSGLALLLLLGLTWILRIHDYARILVCRPPDDDGLAPHSPWKTLRDFFRATGFTYRFYGKTLALWLLFFLSQIAIFPVYGLLKPYLAFNGPLGIYTGLGVGQILILFRIAAGIALLAGQAKFLKGVLESEPAEEKPPSPILPEPALVSPENRPVDPDETVFLPSTGAMVSPSAEKPKDESPASGAPVADRPVYDPIPPGSEDKPSS